MEGCGHNVASAPWKALVEDALKREECGALQSWSWKGCAYSGIGAAVSKAHCATLRMFCLECRCREQQLQDASAMCTKRSTASDGRTQERDKPSSVSRASARMCPVAAQAQEMHYGGWRNYGERYL